MDFKRYFGKIKNKDKKPKHEPEIVEEIEQNVVDEVEPKIVEDVDVNVKKPWILWIQRKIHMNILKDILRNQNTKVGSTVIIQIIQYTMQLGYQYRII